MQISLIFLFHSFTIGVWIKLNTNYPATKLPLLCTQDNLVCLSVIGGNVMGKIGLRNVTGSTVLPSGHWIHVMMRFEAQSEFKMNFGYTPSISLYMLQFLHCVHMKKEYH